MTWIIFDVAGAGTGSTRGTKPLCINSSSVVSGQYEDTAFNTHGFVRAADGTITTFTPTDATQTYPAGINDSGVIAGWYEISTILPQQGFVRAADGTITSFGPNNALKFALGRDFTIDAIQYGIGRCINASGVICGAWRDTDSLWHGFVRDADGTFNSFDVSGLAPFFGPFVPAINANGICCGSYPVVAGQQRGFVRDTDGTITVFDAPLAGTGSGHGTFPYNMNDSGTIIGISVDNSGFYHGFLRASDGTFTTFDIPDGTVPLPVCINSAGVVIGHFLGDADASFHGFIRAVDGTITTFDVSDPSTTDGTAPWSINDSGIITGFCFDAATTEHGFISALTPPPVVSRCVDVKLSGVLPTLEVTRDLDADWDSSSTFIITQDEPLPFTLRGIVLRMSYNPD